jgi:hypothetical protein
MAPVFVIVLDFVFVAVIVIAEAIILIHQFALLVVRLFVI